MVVCAASSAPWGNARIPHADVPPCEAIVVKSACLIGAELLCDRLPKAFCADDDITRVSRVEAMTNLGVGSGSTRSRGLKETLSEARAAHRVSHRFV